MELAPRTVRLVASARIADTEKTAIERLRATEQQQENMLKLFQELLSQLDDWNEFQDLIRDTRALREKQRELQFRTRRVGGTRNGGNSSKERK